MAAVMMQAHGTETMIVKDGNKYSADFRYKNVDYEQDEYNGRCYFLDTSRSFTSQVAREGGLVRRRISRAAYEEAKAAAIKVVEQAAALEEAAKGTQEEWEKALDLFGEYLTGEQEEPKRQKVREPYTREELEAVYDRKIEAEVRHWGEHSFWANMAREVKVDEKAVRSYNAMFSDELEYKTQSVVGWNLKPDILIHGSPCQDFSIAGHQGKATAEAGRINRGKGADKGSGTRSSLMWETIHIIEQMGEWKPKYVIWENVKNVLSRYMRVNFNRYLSEMERLGYSNNFEILDAREFGLPQARERVFTVSVLGNEKFSFDDLIKTPMRNISDFLLSDAPPVYDVTQPSVLEAIGKKGIRRATVIEDYAFTITARQDRTPAQVIDMGNGRYRYLTELECWRLQGYTDADFKAAAAVHKRVGRYTMPLYKQAGNSIPVPIFESLFRKMILHETTESEAGNGNI